MARVLHTSLRRGTHFAHHHLEPTSHQGKLRVQSFMSGQLSVRERRLLWSKTVEADTKLSRITRVGASAGPSLRVDTQHGPHLQQSAGPSSQEKQPLILRLFFVLSHRVLLSGRRLTLCFQNCVGCVRALSSPS